VKRNEIKIESPKWFREMHKDTPIEQLEYLIDLANKIQAEGYIPVMADLIVGFWKNEVNSNGKSFDYNSQDLFRGFYERVTEMKLLEEYPPENFLEKQKEYFENVFAQTNQLVEFYQKHVRLFSSYDRERLMIDEYKKQSPASQNVSDHELKMRLDAERFLPQREVYFKSPFYQEFGFLERDYHYEIFRWCQNTIATIKSSFKNDKLFQSVHDTELYAPYFSLGKIEELHKLVDGRQFHEMPALEFFHTINLISRSKKFKIQGDEKKRVMYLIYCLAQQIKDKTKSANWEREVLKRLGLDSPSNYNKHKTDIAGDGESPENQDFCKKINEILS